MAIIMHLIFMSDEALNERKKYVRWKKKQIQTEIGEKSPASGFRKRPLRLSAYHLVIPLTAAVILITRCAPRTLSPLIWGLKCAGERYESTALS